MVVRGVCVRGVWYGLGDIFLCGWVDVLKCVGFLVVECCEGFGGFGG